MKTRKYNDPFRGDIELTKIVDKHMSAMGENRTDSLWSDDRGGVYWFIESTAAIEPIEPIYVPSDIAEMIGESVGMRKRHFGEDRRCTCDPSTFRPYSGKGFYMPQCWKCDAFYPQEYIDQQFENAKGSK